MGLLYLIYIYIVDRDSSVGISARYKLDGPGIESRFIFYSYIQITMACKICEISQMYNIYIYIYIYLLPMFLSSYPP